MRYLLYFLLVKDGASERKMVLSPICHTDSPDIETETLERILVIRDPKRVKHKPSLSETVYKASMCKRFLSGKNSEIPPSNLSTSKYSNMAGVTSGLDQLVQASLFSNSVFRQKDSSYTTVDDGNQVSYSHNAMSKSSSDTYMVTKKQTFDKNQVYRARFCGSSTDPCCHYALHGFRFCIKHILEDHLAPYKQCDYFECHTQMRCPYPVCVNVVDAR